MPLRSRPSLEVHLGDGLERGSGEDREQLASPAQPLHPNLRQEEPDPSQYDLFFPLSGLLGIHRPFFSLTQLSCYVTDISFQSLVISSFFF